MTDECSKLRKLSVGGIAELPLVIGCSKLNQILNERILVAKSPMIDERSKFNKTLEGGQENHL